ncbi:MAG: ELM1/GtrOC1 family putative glycosyltransferase [Agitococcus sp.]|nr:ELM1/GtrOC1 family putative glycosyltransferase [Agitococcus sp.]
MPPTSSPQSPLIIWQFVDGKSGHEQQSLGLAQAIARYHPVQTIKIDIRQHPIGVMDFILKRLPLDYPLPQYVIGAGHRTHLALLTAKRVTHAKSIVLMKPSLPVTWFDYALIPEHDSPVTKANVLATRGVLNTVQPSTQLNPKKGVMLLGGASKRHGWDDKQLVIQMKAVLASTPEIEWQISTSRRTPEHLLLEIRHIASNAKVWSAQETPQGWVAAQLQQAGQAWVTEDSISMLYEALTAGGQVGVLAVPRLQTDRITDAIDELIKQQCLTTFAQWQEQQQLAPAHSFCEADRAARWLLEQEGLWINDSE